MKISRATDVYRVIAFMLWLQTVMSLECWFCLSDCQYDPTYNYRSDKVTCQPGESCQKVIYRGKDSKSLIVFTSVVRSCSQGPCRPRIDNCTETLITNPGCIARYCCDDKNLCNGGPTSLVGAVNAMKWLAAFVPFFLR